MERNDTIDYLKFFAIFFVVCIHTLPFSTFRFHGIDGVQITFIINIFARFGVPFFFMVSGYLIGQKLASYKQNIGYIKKYLSKTVKLLLSWTLFFFVYDLAMTAFKSLFQGLSIRAEITLYLAAVFHPKNIYYGVYAGTSYHLWYLAALIWSIVILALFIKMDKLKWLLLISFSLHLIGILGQIDSSYIDTRDALFFGLFYVTLGYYFAIHVPKLRGRFSPKTWIILFFLFSLMQIIEGEGFIHTINGINGVWSNYYFFTIPTVVSLFFFALSKPAIYHPTINKMGANSVGIYVIHPLFISISYISINLFHLNHISHTFLWNLFFTPFIFIISYVSYHYLQKLKAIILKKS